MNGTVRRSGIALPLATLTLLPVGAAHAATAPTKYVAFTPSGEQSISPQVLGVAPDASEVLLNVTPTRNAGNPEAVIFDVAKGTTTPLLSGIGAAESVSNDLRRVLLVTTAGLDPADTNGEPDLYLYDRTTGKVALVSRTPSGGADGVENAVQTGYLSGDGTSVIYAGVPASTGIMRYDVASGTTTTLGSSTFAAQRPDTAGKVIVTGTGGLYVGSKYTAFAPAASVPAGASFVTSPDGSAIGAFLPHGGLEIITTSTGAVRTVPLSTTIQNYGLTLIQVANGGASAVIGTSRPSGSAIVGSVNRINTTTGALTQIGGDIAYASGVPVVATPDDAFAVSESSLVQLGATPIPGGTGPAPPAINPTDYLFFRPGCSYGSYFAPAVSPSLQLVATSKGADPHVPTKAVVTVTGPAGTVTNQFILAANAKANITPTSGNFTYQATVTFSDGVTNTGAATIAPYTPIKNTGNAIQNLFAPSACLLANR